MVTPEADPARSLYIGDGGRRRGGGDGERNDERYGERIDERYGGGNGGGIEVCDV